MKKVQHLFAPPPRFEGLKLARKDMAAYYTKDFPDEIVGVPQADGTSIEVKVKLVDLPIDKVRFCFNPRIKETIEEWKKLHPNQEPDQQVWYDLNFQAGGTEKLIAGIKQTGRTADRIWVDSTGGVREGNGRTVAYKYLHGIEPDRSNWKTIPAMLFPLDFCEDDWLKIVSLRALFHRDWPSTSKAYSYRELLNQGNSIRDLATMLSQTEEQVNIMIRTAFFMDDYRKITGHPVGDRDKFTKLWKCAGHTSLLKAMGFDGKDNPKWKKEFEKFANLVADGTIKACTHVTDVLPKVWDKQDAKIWTTMLEKGTKVIKDELDQGDSKTKLADQVEKLVAKLKKLKKSEALEIQQSETDKRKRERGALNNLRYVLDDVLE
jgi:hypothetical protein